MQTKEILGVDVGATGIKAGIVDIETGKLVQERIKLPTPKPATPEAVAKVVVDLVAKTGYTGSLMGCGFPSIVRNGVAYSAANIDEGWIGTNIETLLSTATGLDVVSMNDADAAGLSEMRYGKGKGKMGTVMLITIGSGLGSALFTDGHLVRNSEFGHLHLKGWVAEHYVSNTARKNYEMSWPSFGKRFNEYLLHIDRLFSPDLIILGGGISNMFEEFGPHIDPKLNVTTAAMFNQAGIIGAALYAFEAKFGAI
ncbi:MAG: ROK family protein [Saprospiraceae bacterium]|jgi:polyphosphate glucokinase|nr:ROK family protein [Saprospiraceae bacterium]